MNTNEMAEQVGETAQKTAETMKETAQDWGNKARSKARDFGAAADLYVHEYTWATVATTAVLAGLIGFLIGRRR